VRRLVLVETALKPQAEGAEREAMLHQLDTDYRGLLGSAYRAFGRDSAQGEELLAYAATLDSARMTRWIRLALTTDLSVPVAALRTPTLAVLAERSWPLGEPWSLTRDALGYTAAPNVEPLRVMNSGHFVMLDQPAALAAAIERFTAQPAFDLVAQR
jgi:pimeloyl-ACP methyl ester carboxylesterase